MVWQLAWTPSTTGATEYEWLAQGWTEDERRVWYTLSQGSRLIPEPWLRAVYGGDTQHGWGRRAFARHGYPFAAPGDPLPIGFTRHRDSRGVPWIGMNCAACHTAVLSNASHRLIVDGASTLADFQAMLDEIVGAVRDVYADAEAWVRFEKSVRASGAVSSDADLRAEVAAWLDFREKLLRRNRSSDPYGPGRLDAMGQILNKVVELLAPGQPPSSPSDAPASYPPVWNAHQQARLHWNAMVTNGRRLFPNTPRELNVDALGRNVGQTIGVFGGLEVIHGPRLHNVTVDIENLIQLEQLVAELDSPRWPEKIFGPVQRSGPVYALGRRLYNERCRSCHQIVRPGDRATPLATPTLSVFSPRLGTDPWLACNVVLHESETGPFRARSDFGGIAPTVKLLAALVTDTIEAQSSRFSESGMRGTQSCWRSGRLAQESMPPAPNSAFVHRKEQALAQCRRIAEEGDDETRRLIRYKARPLNGIWATAPYLHNGSVPTLRALLTAPDYRPRRFQIGNAEFDPVDVGYVTQETSSRSFIYRVSRDDGSEIPGNSNRGHLYGTDLPENEKAALLEFLKTL